MLTLQIRDGGRTFLVPVEGRPLVIGSDPAADVVLADPAVLGRHAELVPAGAGVRLVAHGPVLANGAPVTAVELQLGDRLELGGALLVLGKSVRRASGPEDVLDGAPRRGRERPRPARSRWLPLVGAALLLGGVVAVVATSGDGSSVQAELALVARLRSDGQLERAAAQVAKLRQQWAVAADDRLQQLDREQAALDAVHAAVAAMLAEIKAPGERTYAQWNVELQRREAEGAPAERIAARLCRAQLGETLRQRPKPKFAPVAAPAAAAPAVAAAPREPAASAPVAPAAAAPAAPAPTAPAVAAGAAVAAEADQLAAQGLFAQALSLLEAEGAAAANPADAAALAERAAAVQRRAGQALQELLASAREQLSANDARAAVTLLAQAQHRFPGTPAFAALTQELRRAEALLAAAAAPAASAAAANRTATLSALRSQLDAVREAEDRADFAAAAALLREAAAAVRDRDADFAARLERRADEAGQLGAWHAAVAQHLARGKPCELQLDDGRTALVQRVDGAALVGEAQGEAVRATWRDVAPAAVAKLAELLRVTGDEGLGAAALLYRGGETAAAEALLAKCLRADAAHKPAIDLAIARGRGEPLDPRGYTLGKDGAFVSARSLDAQRFAGQLKQRLDAALRAKDAAPRAALLAEVRGQGEEAVAGLVAALQNELGAQHQKLASGPLRKQFDKLAAQRAELDRVREHARSLIYDEVKYFYPYKPPAVSSDKFAEYNRVQAEVDARVAALRTVWQDDRIQVKVPASLRTDLERIDWLVQALGELGAVADVAAEDLDWLRALPAGAAVGIRDFCLTGAERAELDEWRRIEAYNAVVGRQLGSAVREQLRITNAYRAMFRHRPLAVVVAACAASQGHADEMSKLGYFAHMSPTPGRKTPYDRMKLAGYPFGVSENIALVDGAQGAHDAWCRSSGHHRNLLHPGHREMGIGANGRYWVQNFGSGTVHRDDPAWQQPPAKNPPR